MVAHRWDSLGHSLAECPQLLMFTGKGGVGKTTCAAAAALFLADRGRDTLLFSTDPAHSLADSLAMPIGPTVRSVPGVRGLSALELDAQGALAGARQRFGAGLQDLLLSATYLDEDDAALLLDLDLPGLDELMALQSIFDLLAEQPPRYQHLVWDAAPTGHTLRLLELPDLVDGWVRVLARILWKYRDLIALPTSAYDATGADDLLLAMKRTIRYFAAVVRDPARSCILPVTIPEPMAGAETQRLLARLRLLSIPVSAAIVNGIPAASLHCRYCTVRHRHAKKSLEQLVTQLEGLRLTLLPAYPAPVVGIRSLRSLALSAPPV